MRICICGGGNLGHVTAGMLALKRENSVSVLTRKPELWSRELILKQPDGSSTVSRLAKITSIPEDVISQSDIVLICLPGFAIQAELVKIKPFLDENTIVGTIVSSTGFFFEAHKILPLGTKLFGFQRVPYISRILEYGKEAEVKGVKPSLRMAVENIDDRYAFSKKIENLFDIPVELLDNYFEVSLSNSNPLLHPARLYSMWKDWHLGIEYNSVPRFYEDWNEEASELYIEMDNELQSLLDELHVRKGAIVPVLEYYESTDAVSLTNKISHIPAFAGIMAPMVRVESGKYIPDFSSRYFTEDFPYGMRYILEANKSLSNSVSFVDLSLIEKIYKWGSEKIEKQR